MTEKEIGLREELARWKDRGEQISWRYDRLAQELAAMKADLRAADRKVKDLERGLVTFGGGER